MFFRGRGWRQQRRGFWRQNGLLRAHIIAGWGRVSIFPPGRMYFFVGWLAGVVLAFFPRAGGLGVVLVFFAGSAGWGGDSISFAEPAGAGRVSICTF